MVEKTLEKTAESKNSKLVEEDYINFKEFKKYLAEKWIAIKGKTLENLYHKAIDIKDEKKSLQANSEELRKISAELALKPSYMARLRQRHHRKELEKEEKELLKKIDNGKKELERSKEKLDDALFNAVANEICILNHEVKIYNETNPYAKEHLNVAHSLADDLNKREEVRFFQKAKAYYAKCDERFPKMVVNAAYKSNTDVELPFEFMSKQDFAKYVEKTYGNKKSKEGKNEEVERLFAKYNKD